MYNYIERKILNVVCSAETVFSQSFFRTSVFIYNTRFCAFICSSRYWSGRKAYSM